MAEVIYIAGSGHSGSSLLDVLLGNHPHVTGLGEVHKALLDSGAQICACGTAIVKCEFWVRVLDALAQRHACPLDTLHESYPITIVRHSRKPRIIPNALEVALMSGSRIVLRLATLLSKDVKRHLAMASNSWLMYDIISSLEGTPYVVDSTKNAVRLGLLYAERPDSLRVIHLVRDPCAVAASAKRRKRQSIAEAAKKWRLANRNVMLILRAIPAAQKYRLRYEDLCDDPKREMRKLSHFLGLEFAEETAKLSVRQAHSIPGNPMLFSRSTEIRKDVRWIGELSARDLEYVDLVAGDLRGKFGYGDYKA